MGNEIRCRWCNMKNQLYIDYHDGEWCVPRFDDQYLYEMLILESFQAGLSWECVLNKRESFREAYDSFDIDNVIAYSEDKIDELLQNNGIIRNKLKIILGLDAKIMLESPNTLQRFEGKAKRVKDLRNKD